MQSVGAGLVLLIASIVHVAAMMPQDLSLSSHLPVSWGEICQVLTNASDDVNATISCHVTPRDEVQWRLADLRSSLEPIVNSTLFQVALTIDCETGGNISLPWPMRAPGLARLTVHNCRLLDKYADFGTSALELGDWLRYLDMRDCTWVNEPGSMDIIFKNFASLTSHYECGQDSTLVSYIYRNVSDELKLDNLLRSSSPGDLDLGALKGSGDLGSLLNGTAGFGGNLGNNSDLGGLLNGTNLPGKPHTSRDTTQSPLTSQLGGGSTFKDPASDVLDTLTDLAQFSFSCKFEHLEIMDESFSPLTSKEHFEFLVKDSTFPKLRILNYTYIGMTEVPRELRQWRRYFPALHTIDLSHNYIQELDTITPFPYEIPLAMILQHNNISNINLQMFKDWAKVPNFYVDIRGNPIDCSCEEFRDFLEDLKDPEKWKGQVMTYYYDYLLLMTCVTPSTLAGRTLGSLTYGDLPCPTAVADLRAAMVVLAIVAVVLLVLLILAVRYRREVRILMFTRVHILLPCGLARASSGNVSEKKYDAFVAYAHQDSDWVLGQLMTKLEGPTTRACGPCKLCIHQRDFVVGKPIIDNIIDCIAASRHTIVVLSPSFAKSSWAMEELQQAYRQSLEERRRHLVLVVLEDVTQSDMAPILRRCCKTFTYIHVNDTLFWDRLMYSIHVTAADNNTSSKTKEIKGSQEYDNVAYNIKDTPENKDVESKLPLPREPVDPELQRTVFQETMRTISVDSTSTTVSTVSETGKLV